MFVEIARLLIVVLSTGAGYGIARSSAGDGSPWVVVGAVSQGAAVRRKLHVDVNPSRYS